MIMSKFAKVAAAMGFVAACACGLAACGSGGGSAASVSPDAVAATVYGVDIKESKISVQVETIRAQMGLDDDAIWAQYLAQFGMTPEALREQLLEPYINYELVRHDASELGVSISQEDVDAEVASTRSHFVVTKSNGEEDVEATNKAWQAALEGANFTEEEYRKTIEAQMLDQAVRKKLADEAQPSEEDVFMYAQMYNSTYNGSRRSSHILFAASDAELAQSVLDQINNGSLDFAEAARTYSIDTGSAADGGNVGWDTGGFVTEYSSALAELEPGQVSGLVTSQFGIHIIMCTGYYESPEEFTSADQLPADLYETVVNYAKSSASSTLYSEWIAERRKVAEESGNLVINPIPAGLSYNVDVSPYLAQTPAATGEGESAAAEGSSGGAASSEGAASAAGSEGAASAESADAAASSASVESPNTAASSESADSATSSEGSASSGSAQ